MKPGSFPKLELPLRLGRSPAQTSVRSQPKVAAGPKTDSFLESLPTEILRQILSNLDLDDLNVMVHLSPIIYQLYLLDQSYLFKECAANTITFDAHAVYLTSSTDFFKSRSNETVRSFLRAYQNQQLQPSLVQCPIFTEITKEQAEEIVSFRSSIIMPLIRRYTEWAFANLGRKKGEWLRSHRALSGIEETRLMRAFYRFQLCCNLFLDSRSRLELSQDAYWRRPSLSVKLQEFYSILEPWEVEEMLCIHEFAKENFSSILASIGWDVHEDNPRFDGQGPGTPNGAFNLELWWDEYVEGTIGCGLELLHTVLFEVRDHASIVSLMQEHMATEFNSIQNTIAPGVQSERILGNPSEQDEKQERRDALPFQGDKPAHPPLAWTLIWGETYSTLYGFYVPFGFRRWGYVLWDVDRLERTRAKEVLAEQWTARWGNEDPRDGI